MFTINLLTFLWNCAIIIIEGKEKNLPGIQKGCVFMRKFVRAYGMDRNCEPSCIVEVEVVNDNYSKAYARAKELTRLNGELVYDYEEVTGE